MSKLEEVRMKIENDRKQAEQRAAELDKIRGQIADMDRQIDEAIEAGNNGVAEKLIAKQGDIRTKLSVMERISAHKNAPDTYFNELLAICTDYAAEMQPKIDKVSEELQKARTEYLEKMTALSKMLSEAGRFRAECGTLAGLGALWSNTRFDAFPCVKYRQEDLECTDTEADLIMKMDPDFMLRFNEINSYVGFKY